MPRLKLGDGAELAWEARGEGPPVVFSIHTLGYPQLFEALLEGLAANHRTITYDLRGHGESSPGGPWNQATDIDDLAALLEGLGEPAVALALGDGCNRAVKLAASRPDLIGSVVVTGGNPLGRTVVEGTRGLAASDSVLELLLEQLSNDYRGALRTLLSSTNPQMTEDGRRERVETQIAYAPQEPAVTRFKEWVEDSAGDEALAVGDRLWILYEAEGNPWFTRETFERTRQLLPEAHLVEVENGPLSRPDLAVEIVERITASDRAVRR